MKTAIKTLLRPSQEEHKNDLSHIGIIMDGNGRWATKNNKTKIEAYEKGAQVAQNIALKANQIGLKYLSLYAFSYENWKRPKIEVEALLQLLKMFIDNKIDQFAEHNIKVKVIGDFAPLSEDLLSKIALLENKTRNNTGLQINIALSYGGRQEIIYAIRRLAIEVKTENISIRDINENMVKEYLYLPDLPDPDLIIRTSGEKRLSNFLLWQSAYSELYFTDILWPDFTDQNLLEAINEYYNRSRRYGS